MFRGLRRLSSWRANQGQPFPPNDGFAPRLVRFLSPLRLLFCSISVLNFLNVCNSRPNPAFAPPRQGLVSFSFTSRLAFKALRLNCFAWRLQFNVSIPSYDPIRSWGLCPYGSCTGSRFDSRLSWKHEKSRPWTGQTVHLPPSE